MVNNITVIGEPLQVEIGGKRFYRVGLSDGTFRLLRSVTSITHGARLPSYLDEWEKQQVEALGVQGYKDAMNQKAQDGTDLHKIIEDHIHGKEYEIQDSDVKKMYENYLRWEEKRQPQWAWNEKTLYSLRFGYAGRCDGLAGIGRRSPIIDFKSAKKAQTEHLEQGSAYLMACGEMKEYPDSVLILCLGSETKQGFTETWLDNPYDITRHFFGFQFKNQLINHHNPI